VLIWLQVAFDKWWPGKFCDENVLQKFNANAKHPSSMANASSGFPVFDRKGIKQS
jgi:hypothetical protein